MVLLATQPSFQENETPERGRGHVTPAMGRGRGVVYVVAVRVGGSPMNEQGPHVQGEWQACTYRLQFHCPTS